MNSIYNHAIKQSTTLRKDLESFESNITSAPLSLIGSLTTTLSQLTKTISDYEESINKQFLNDKDNLKKDKNLQKLSTLQAQLREFKDSFANFKRERDESLVTQSRQQLFERKPVSENPYTLEQDHRDDQDARLAYEDGMMKEHHSLRSGNEQLDHILEMASSSYENLVSQNEFLGNMSQKIQNASGNLRLSGLTLSKIENRMREDKAFFYGGCAFVIFCFYLILRYFG